jgi:D-methionine transport system substrate-binding protein
MSAVPPNDDSVVLPPKKSKTGRNVAIAAAAVVVVVAATLVIVNVTNNDSASGLGSADEPVKIGVVGASDPYWSDYADAAEEAGISVDIIDFAEYNLPNPALTEGELDLNQFQHLVYLAAYNTSSGEDLTPIGATAIYPLGLYSDKYESIEDIPEGDTVAVPNDPSNLSRALGVLAAADLISLDAEDPTFATLDDVDEANSKVKITTLEPSLTATSLPDVAAAIVNNDFLEPAGIDPLSAIAGDDPTNPAAEPYINVFAANAEDAENEVLLELVDIYQNSQTVLDGVVEASGGTAIITETPADDLRDILATVEENAAG